ncbi:MAG TPA: hypothetical protein VF807_11310 [Ktedonobacterales bacterium]
MNPSDDPPLIFRGTIQLLQLFDMSYSIDLEQAQARLVKPGGRTRPVVSRGGSIQMPELPVEVALGEQALSVDGQDYQAELYARIYDLGIIALRLTVQLPEPCDWARATEIMDALLPYPPVVTACFERHRDSLGETLGPALIRPNSVTRTEDYSLLIVSRLDGPTTASALAQHPALLQATLGEPKRLSASATSLATTLSYYDDDLIILTWNGALVIEPDALARDDVGLLLEFANAQLLALRTYDDEVQADLTQLTATVRARHPPLLGLSRTSQLQRDIATLIADINDTSARVENALKVTEDVYWNRVYAAAIRTLRVQVWRDGIAGSVEVLRQTSALLHDEAETALTVLLEVLVIVLIAVELDVAVISLRGH